MIGHAAGLYQTEQGIRPDSLAQMEQARCTPGKFGEGALVCPDGGTYSLEPDSSCGVCSVHGRPGALIPGCEIPLSTVSPFEAEMYRQFVNQYNQYWREFFDPIAVRIQVQPERYRVETIILPLIDNSIYTGLAMALGGEPKPLDLPPVSQRNIFTVALKLNKQRLLQEAGWAPPTSELDQRTREEAARRASAENLARLGIAMHNHHDVFGHFPPAAVAQRGQTKFKHPHSWRVAILPFLDQRVLYDQYNFDEPWDSEHNKKLLQQMPAVFRSPDAPADSTSASYFALVGPGTVFDDERGMDIRQIMDGTSNTILLVEAERDIPWTKPEDIPYDPKKPLPKLGEARLVVLCDGSVGRLSETIDEKTARALITRAGGEVIQHEGNVEPVPRRPTRRDDPFGLNQLTHGMLDEREVYEFVTQGLGDRIALHVYDADPLFDFQLVGFLGRMLGSFAAGRPGGMDSEVLLIAPLIASFNTPISVSVPVEDSRIADRFLSRLDTVLAELARRPPEGFFFPIEKDFYALPIGQELAARSFGIQIGPVKLRFFWARIGEAIHIASKPFILEDLAAMWQADDSSASHPTNSADSTGHAMMRIRADHWNRVLPAYRLGWAERHRMACVDNVGRLSSLARLAVAQQQHDDACDIATQTARLAHRLYGVEFFCPEGGSYLAADDGKTVSCSVHGCAVHPRQAAVGRHDGAIDAMLRELSGLTATLTFLEDGLHAVLTIDRAPRTPSASR